VRSPGYDSAGNISSDSAAYTSTYNLAGRLSTMLRSGVTTTFTYDAMGRRVRKFSSSGTASTVIFAYGLAGHLIGEYGSTGAAIREYVWLGDVLVAVFSPDVVVANAPLVYFIHADHLDTPRLVLDRSNGIRWRWLAEPFGTTAPEANPQGLGAFAFNLRFPGQYADSETGLNYNFFRDYDPSTGRYVQSDPIGLVGGINTYTYVAGQPTKFSDPTGLMPANPRLPSRQQLKQCPEPCPIVESSIEIKLANLKKAWIYLYYDPNNLFNNAWGRALPEGGGTWIGHLKNFRELQVNLNKDIDTADELRCNDTPEARLWGRMMPPMAPFSPNPATPPPF